MQTYIVLLRGVMPTGKNRVPMAALREALTRAGFEGVATWIQSGNAIVRTPLSPSGNGGQGAGDHPRGHRPGAGRHCENT